MRIGVVGYQGDVEEHMSTLKKIRTYDKVEICKVKSKSEVESLDGMIIPGGESTTIYKLMMESGIYDKVVEMALDGMPIMGTCAGVIILSKNTNDSRVRGMGLMDLEIQRNGYGRQWDSFIENVDIKYIGEFPAVFIRAPTILNQSGCEVMATLREKPIMVRKDNIIGLTFHPELTENTKIHEYFLSVTKGERGRFPLEV